MTNSSNNSLTPLTTKIQTLGGIVIFLWVLEFIDLVVFRGYLNTYGIHPRHLDGLSGIIFAPFLHGNFRHLIANTAPLIIFGWLILLRNYKDFWIVSLVAMIVSGLGVWIFGSPYTIHIGASGVIFGYLGFLLFRGIFDRSLTSILLSLFVGWLYGGLVWGVLPSQIGISWQGHLFGFLGGIFAAQLLSKRNHLK